MVNSTMVKFGSDTTELRVVNRGIIQLDPHSFYHSATGTQLKAESWNSTYRIRILSINNIAKYKITKTIIYFIISVCWALNRIPNI